MNVSTLRNKSTFVNSVTVMNKRVKTVFLVFYIFALLACVKLTKVSRMFLHWYDGARRKIPAPYRHWFTVFTKTSQYYIRSDLIVNELQFDVFRCYLWEKESGDFWKNFLCQAEEFHKNNWEKKPSVKVSDWPRRLKVMICLPTERDV